MAAALFANKLPRPKVDLKYTTALQEGTINCSIILAQKYMQEPEKFAAFDSYQGPDGHWQGVTAVRRAVSKMLFSQCRNDLKRDYGDDFAAQLNHMMNVAAQRIGINAETLADSGTLSELLARWERLFWAKLEPGVYNPALENFAWESGAFMSDGFWTLPLTVPGGAAIEGAYGFALNMAGNIIELKPTDPMYLWIAGMEPTGGDIGYQYQVERDLQILNEIKNAQHILSLGAGWLPEIRHSDLLLGDEAWPAAERELYACDIDPKIPHEFFGDALSNNIVKVDYHKQSINDALMELNVSRPHSFDLVYMKGVLSFMPQLYSKILGAVLPLLRDGGKFVFDIQLNHYILQRDILLFGWGGARSETKLHLMSQDEAATLVKSQTSGICQHLGLKTNWHASLLNEVNPVGLMFFVDAVR